MLLVSDVVISAVVVVAAADGHGDGEEEDDDDADLGVGHQSTSISTIVTQSGKHNQPKIPFSNEDGEGKTASTAEWRRKMSL